MLIQYFKTNSSETKTNGSLFYHGHENVSNLLNKQPNILN